jgi:hypothetical protein
LLQPKGVAAGRQGRREADRDRRIAHIVENIGSYISGLRPKSGRSRTYRRPWPGRE